MFVPSRFYAEILEFDAGIRYHPGKFDKEETFMAPITPKALSEREFTKTIRGYNPSEVDSYINRVVENYAYLYRENIELAKRLSEATSRLENLSSEEELVRQTLQTAKRAGDKVIEEAYIKADDILASIKSSCDSILRNFRDKIEAQKNALAEIQQNILTFKNELFEKYRLHIELIEQISPVYEYEEDLTPDEYVERVVTDLKREVAAQYGISLDSLAAPDNAQTKVAQDTSDLPPATPEAAPPIVAVDTQPQKPAPIPKKRKPRAVPSVMELLDEYEDPEVLREAKAKQPKARQFMLDIDGNNENAELVLSGK